MRRFSIEEKSRLLRNHFLLSTLSDEDLEKLARYSQVQQVESGTVIFSKNDAGDSMMVIIEGRVMIGSTSISGKELVLNILGEGDVLGEIAFVDGEARTADARALEATTYLVLERRYFQPLLEEQPKLAAQLLGILCQRLRNTTDQMEDTAFYELKTRLARKLLAFADHFGERQDDQNNIELPVNQSELGAMLSATRESVNRQLRELANADLISLKQGAITIIDRDGLDDVAQEYS